MRDDRSFQERFADIYKFSKEAIGYASLDGVLIDVNDSYTKLTGCSKEELIFRKKYHYLTPEEYHEFEVQIFEKILTTGEPIEYEKEFIRKDGSRVPILLTAFLVRNSNSNPVGFTSIIRDITERKRIEQTLREQVNLLSLTHDAIVVCDMNRIIKYWNRGAEELYGWTAEQAIGNVIYDILKTVFPVPVEQIETEVMSTGRWKGELVHTKNMGPKWWWRGGGFCSEMRAVFQFTLPVDDGNQHD